MIESFSASQATVRVCLRPNKPRGCLWQTTGLATCRGGAHPRGAGVDQKFSVRLSTANAASLVASDSVG